MNDQISKTKFLTTNAFKELDLFSSQLKTTVTLTPNSSNEATHHDPFISQTFNFLQSKAKALFLGSMPDEEGDFNNSSSSRNNEESEFLYFPFSPIPKFKENELEVSDFILR